MKNLIALVILGLAAYFGCVIWLNFRKPPEPPPQIVVAPTPPPTPVATPIATPTATPIARRLAPEGTYFLMESVSVRTDDGISGLRPGTRLTLITDSGDTLRVKSGDLRFDVKPHQVTNDLDIAARVGNIDAQAQQAGASARAQGGSVAIIQATYGYGNSVVDVTNRVRAQLLLGRNTIRADSELAGIDPASGKVKTLTIHYSVGSLPSTVAVLREGESITLGPSRPEPQPTPTPEIRVVERQQNRQNPLDRGAYDKKRDVARPPRIRYVP